MNTVSKDIAEQLKEAGWERETEFYVLTDSERDFIGNEDTIAHAVDSGQGRPKKKYI